MARLSRMFAVVLALSATVSASQTLTIADLGSFAGEWTLTLDSPQGSRGPGNPGSGNPGSGSRGPGGPSSI